MKRLRKAKAKSKKARRRSQGWLAKQLGCTQQRVSQLIGREGWRWPKRDWTDDQVKKIKAWHAALRDENPATADGATAGDTAPDELGDITDPQELLKLVHKPETRLKLMGVIERAAKVKVDRELLLGGYLKKEDVDAGRVARVQAERQELSNVRLLAIKMEGMAVPDMERVLEEWARDVCQKFERAHGGGDGIGG